MSLRTRLIIAFLLLSVLPLTAVTLLSYRSSVTAFERAAERDAADSAADVSRRMDIITADVGRRVDRLFTAGELPLEADVRQQVAPALGETAALVERVEFVPAERPAGPTEPAVGGQPPMPSRAPAATAGVAPAPPTPPTPPVPKVIVMDVPRIMEEAKRVATAEMKDTDPALVKLIEQSMAAAMTGTEIGIRAANEALSKQAANEAAEARKALGLDDAGSGEDSDGDRPGEA